MEGTECVLRSMLIYIGWLWWAEYWSPRNGSHPNPRNLWVCDLITVKETLQVWFVKDLAAEEIILDDLGWPNVITDVQRRRGEAGCWADVIAGRNRDKGMWTVSRSWKKARQLILHQSLRRKQRSADTLTWAQWKPFCTLTSRKGR